MRLRWLLALLCLCIWYTCPVGASPDDDDDAEQMAAEIKMGRQAIPYFERHATIVTVGPQVARLRVILKREIPHSGRPKLPYTVKIIDSPIVNAVTLPGGFIYVYRGLLDQKPDDAMLACILGHEITHAARSHGYRKMAEYESLGALTGGGIGSQLFNILLTTGVGRTYEYQADRLGMHVAADSGYDPHGAIRAMHMLDRVAHEHPGLLSSLLATHPAIPDRITRLKAELAAMGR